MSFIDKPSVLLHNGVKIPTLGFRVRRTDKNVYQNILTAIHAGYRHFDVCSDHDVEKTFARACRDSGLKREDFFLTVKIANSDHGFDAARHGFRNSLSRLQTDYVDIYYLHRTHGVSVEKVAEAMGRLIDDGLIRGWGLSQVDVDVIDRAHRITPLAAIQNIYSMVERDSEAEIIPYCIENNIGFVPFSPIASSLLSGKITPQTQFERNDDVRNWVPQLSRANIAGNQPIVEMLIEFAQKKDATPAQISLAWMLYKYPNVVPIPGSKNKERIVENLNSSNVELTDEEFTALEESLNALKVYGHRGLGGF